MSRANGRVVYVIVSSVLLLLAGFVAQYLLLACVCLWLDPKFASVARYQLFAPSGAHTYMIEYGGLWGSTVSSSVKSGLPAEQSRGNWKARRLPEYVADDDGNGEEDDDTGEEETPSFDAPHLVIPRWTIAATDNQLREQLYDQPNQGVIEYAVGKPWLSAAFCIAIDVNGAQPETHINILAIDRLGRWDDGAAPRGLPLRMIWPGTIGNSLVFAIAIMLLGRLRRWTLRKFRLMRGRCESCGYLKRGWRGDLCPECGTPSPNGKEPIIPSLKNQESK